MCPLLGAVTVERYTARDNNTAVLNEDLYDFFKVQKPWLNTICKCDGVVPEAALEICVLKELIEYLLRVSIFLEFYDDANTLAI